MPIVAAPDECVEILGDRPSLNQSIVQVRKLIDQNRHEESLLAVNRILDTSTKRRHHTLALRAEILYRLHRLQEADQDVQEILRLKPKFGPAMAVRTDILLGQEKFQEALQSAIDEVALKPHLRGPWRRLTIAHLSLHQFVSAISTALQYLELSRDSQRHFARAQSFLSMALHGNGDIDGALGSLGQELTINPNNYWALKHRADIHLAAGRADLALADTRRMMALDPNYVHGVILHLRALANLKKWNDIIAATDRLRQRTPGILFWRAYAHLQVNLAEIVIRELSNEELVPVLRMLLARAFLQMHQFQQAWDHLKGLLVNAMHRPDGEHLLRFPLIGAFKISLHYMRSLDPQSQRDLQQVLAAIRAAIGRDAFFSIQAEAKLQDWPLLTEEGARTEVSIENPFWREAIMRRPVANQTRLAIFGPNFQDYELADD